MLKFIRDSMQGVIAWAIVIMLIIPFALWGVNEYLGNGGPLVAATVNGEEISLQSYRQTYFQQRNRMREMLGKQYDPSIYDETIKKQAMDDMVQREVLFQNALDMGMRVSASTVIKTIQSFEDFQDNGQFSNEIYSRVLASQGESPQGFEQRIQRSILTQQLFSALNGSAIVTQQDVDKVVNLLEQTRDYKTLTLAVADYKNESLATDEALKKYYDTKKSSYMTPEKVSIEYIELNVADLAKDKMPTEEELEQFYEERKSQFSVPEERRTRHILIAVEQDAEKDKIEAARKKAEDIKAKIDKGESFEELAKANSDDPGSSKMGGDLGYFGRGFMEKPFEDAMFAMKAGEVSAPIVTSFGYHIIKLEDIRADESKPFSEVKDQLVGDYQKGIAEKEFYAASEKLTNLAYEVPDTLDDAAGGVGLEIITSKAFGRNGGAGVTKNPKVIAVAFSDEVLKQGYNSEPIEIGENHVVVLRLKEHFEKQQKPLDEVKVVIKKQFINEKARELAKQAGDKLIERMSAGEDVAAIAKELKLEWKDGGSVKRSAQGANRQIVDKVFKLGYPAEGKSIFGGIAVATGDYTVLNLTKVSSPEETKPEDSKIQSIKKNLATMQGQSDFGSVLTSLKKDAYIVVEEGNL